MNAKFRLTCLLFLKPCELAFCLQSVSLKAFATRFLTLSFSIIKHYTKCMSRGKFKNLQKNLNFFEFFKFCSKFRTQIHALFHFVCSFSRLSFSFFKGLHILFVAYLVKPHDILPVLSACKCYMCATLLVGCSVKVL